MRPNLQETADLVTVTEEIFNGKLHFLSSAQIKHCSKMVSLDLISLSSGFPLSVNCEIFWIHIE